jgi:copper chaperone CopZ
MADTLQLKVTGMTCGGCETAVTRALQRLDGVEEVSASHSAGLVGVRFNPDKVTPASIRQRIEALGYAVAP